MKLNAEIGHTSRFSLEIPNIISTRVKSDSPRFPNDQADQPAGPRLRLKEFLRIDTLVPRAQACARAILRLDETGI
jgi:hypothetical protein